MFNVVVVAEEENNRRQEVVVVRSNKKKHQQKKAQQHLFAQSPVAISVGVAQLVYVIQVFLLALRTHLPDCRV